MTSVSRRPRVRWLGSSIKSIYGKSSRAHITCVVQTNDLAVKSSLIASACHESPPRPIISIDIAAIAAADDDDNAQAKRVAVVEKYAHRKSDKNFSSK